MKRWLAGRTPTPEIDEAFAEALRAMPERDDALAWAEDLAALAKPPRGRVMDLVYVKLARELGVEVSAARAAVFPRRRHAHHARGGRGGSLRGRRSGA